MDIVLGHNVFIRRGKGKHFFGEKNVVFDNAIFEVHSANAVITTGKDCFFSYGHIMVCSKAITIGNNVWVGEYSSIRDATHEFSLLHPLGYLDDIIAPIIIGNNVWIGRGCIVLPGSIIGNNVIIAANAVVKGVCIDNGLYGGCPAKLIRLIKDKDRIVNSTH